MAITLKFSKSDRENPWGFRLVGGIDFDQPVVVVKVNENSLAESAGLEVGDIVVRVNDTSTAGLTHNEVHDLLHSAGLEFELGIRKGEITTGIISDEYYDIEISNSIKRALEQEVLSEAINIINNMKNLSGISEQQTPIIQNLSKQEEIVNTVALKSTSEVKKGKKWSTFLMKPEKPIPEQKKKEEQVKAEPYRVLIKKQSRRPSQEKRVQFDQNITELEVDFEGEEFEETNLAKAEEELEDIHIASKPIDSEDIDTGDTEISRENEFDMKNEAKEEEESEDQNETDFVEVGEEISKNLNPEQKPEITSSLETQLLEVQKQLQALAQLPSAIQMTLDAVSKQLANIVGTRESAEQNGDQGENTSSSKEEDEPATEEEFLEDTSLSEKAEVELLEVDLDASSSIGEELEEDIAEQEKKENSVDEENKEERQPSPYSALTNDEKEILKREDELQAKNEKRMEQHPFKPIQRPIILPGGRKWSIPEDAILSFRKPKMSDDKIIETIESNLEVIIGKRKGESNCWMVPSKVIATKRINFLKYQPPPKNLDYLQRSEVYRLVHDMEPPIGGITSRAEKVPAVQDYYEATKEVL